MSKIGDIVERLPSRILQVHGYSVMRRGPNVVLCADGSMWDRTTDGGWTCTHPTHETAPEPATDWQARAIDAGAALARVTAERDEARAERDQLQTLRRVIAEEMGDAHAEADAQRERAAAAESARQLVEHRCAELDRARVEASARQIQAVAEAGKLRAQLADLTHADVTIENVRRVLSGQLTEPTPGTLAHEVAQALQAAARAEREACARECDDEADELGDQMARAAIRTCARRIRGRDA